ncbi:MAG: TonB-dependent receptor, partial [Lutibacter sp.]|nr:TonB-dependent receptor [Lutibacter sp.]
RYSLNSIKHQFNTGLHTRYTDALSQHIAYRFVERTDGERYGVLDASLRARLAKGMVFSLVANNLLNAEYTETNMVPMPKANIMLGLKYRIY